MPRRRPDLSHGLVRSPLVQRCWLLRRLGGIWYPAPGRPVGGAARPVGATLGGVRLDREDSINRQAVGISRSDQDPCSHECPLPPDRHPWLTAGNVSDIKAADERRPHAPMRSARRAAGNNAHHTWSALTAWTNPPRREPLTPISSPQSCSPPSSPSRSE
jgi:hypothetical protein